MINVTPIVRRLHFVLLLFVISAPPDTAEAASDSAPGFHDGADGVSCSYFDLATKAAWKTGRPTSVDADGILDGPRALATDVVEPGSTRRVRRLDISRLVSDWWSGRTANQGILLRNVDGGPVLFHSREASDPALRPQLLLQFAPGHKRYLEPVADATVDCSTFRGLGGLQTLTAHRESWIAMRFNLGSVVQKEPLPPTSAVLILVRTPESPASGAWLDLRALWSPYGQAVAARNDGLARLHPGDRGLETHSEALFVDRFEGPGVDRRWTPGMEAPFAIVESDPGAAFAPLSGRALRVTIPSGKQVGLDLRYRFREQHDAEPEEVFLRYYLRLSRDWLKAKEGGKLPGLAATYGKVGWGGRGWDGSKGWSLRGSFELPPATGHSASGKVVLGTYAYHSGSSSDYGEIIAWSEGGMAGLLEPDRWYCIEQQVRLNSPLRDDGILQAWVDGRLVLSRKNLRLRSAPHIRIEEVWMNIFHGGTSVAPVDMHAFIDNVVVARSYVGPIWQGLPP